MLEPSHARLSAKTTLLRRPRAILLVVAIPLAALALFARWGHISSAPLDFALARQYHSLNIARYYYVRTSSGVPAWERRVARANYEQEPSLELPLFEATVAGAYHVVGGERTWIPRLLSSLFWIIGSVPLYFLARRLGPWWGALVAVAVYLFFPFPFVASTSFQPDPLMMMLLLAAALGIVRHHEQPTTQRLLTAAVLSGLAIFIKPGIAAFFLLPLFAALAFVRQGVRGALTRRSGYVFLVVSLLPAVGAYVHSVLAGRLLTQQPGVEINPRLLYESFYWRGWLDQIEIVLHPPLLDARFSLIVLAGAILAIVLARNRTQRAILLALGTGYALFGLVVSNQVSSHDYYSLPLIPIVGLSAAVVADALGKHLKGLFERRSVQVTAVFAVLLVVTAGLIAKAPELGLPRADPTQAERIKEYEQVGRLVNHSSRALVLDPGGLWYHGWVAGRYWPDEGDILWERRNERLRPMTADERFVTSDERFWPAPGTMRQRPDVFIVGEPMELVRQPDLAVLLSDYRVRAEAPDCLIFDLTRRAGAVDARRDAGSARVNSPCGYSYSFPVAWQRIERGMTRSEVLRLVGQPQRVETPRGLRKPVENWFYSPRDSYAIIFVGGRVFTLASTRRAA